MLDNGQSLVKPGGGQRGCKALDSLLIFSIELFVDLLEEILVKLKENLTRKLSS
jgi:hypothetical protein